MGKEAAAHLVARQEAQVQVPVAGRPARANFAVGIGPRAGDRGVAHAPGDLQLH